jgi:hypothetical protein
MARLTWLGWIGVSAVLVACGKSEGGPDPVSRDQLPARAAALACEGLSGCCQRSGFMFDVAACKQEYTAELEQNIAELDTANVDYDAVAAGECLDALDAHSFCGEFDDDDAEACERIFRGKLALGQPCSSSQECRREPGQSVGCNSEDGIEPQVCTRYDDGGSSRHGKEGEACYTTCFEGDDCSTGSVPVPAPAPGPGVPAPAPVDPAACYRTDGLWCNFGIASPRCARLLPLGEECTSYDSCAGKAFCASDTGVCSAPRANGARCSAADECQSGHCSYDGPSGAPEPVESYCVAEEPITAEECTVDFDEDGSGPSGSSGDNESAPAPAP